MSRKAVLYIAVSLDGRIADEEGGVGWLEGESSRYSQDYGYGEFIRDVDTIFIGKNTYRQIKDELFPQGWPYEDQECYIFTHSQEKDLKGIHFCSGSPVELLETLKTQPGGSIWICGGANLAKQLMEADAIDEYHITMMPALVGKGPRLFPDSDRLKDRKLHLSRYCVENGAIDMVYTRREPEADEC